MGKFPGRIGLVVLLIILWSFFACPLHHYCEGKECSEGYHCLYIYIFGNMFCFDQKYQREGEYILNEVNLFNVFENVIG